MDELNYFYAQTMYSAFAMDGEKLYNLKTEQVEVSQKSKPLECALNILNSNYWLL